MVKNLPAWFFLAIALVLNGIALLPLLRVVVGVDSEISLPFSTTVMFFIGGLMSGLTAMILLVRRMPKLHAPAVAAMEPNNATPRLESRRQTIAMHASGLLLYSGIPLLNFLVAYWLWGKVRHQSPALDALGQDVLNFQIAVYLYLLLSLFMVFALIGIVTTPLVLALHLLATLTAILFAFLGRSFSYPANIPIIQGRYLDTNSAD